MIVNDRCRAILGLTSIIHRYQSLPYATKNSVEILAGLHDLLGMALELGHSGAELY